jgi:hypothetical protein
MPTISTERIRSILSNPTESDDFDMCDAVEELLGLCDALEESFDEYGFEFVEGDDNVGYEGTRDDYYAFMLPPEKCPDAFTAKVYIVAPDDGAHEIVRYRGLVIDDQGHRVFDSDRDADPYWFETIAECIAWLNEQLGWKIERVQP